MIIMQHFHLLVIQLICRAKNTTLDKLLIIVHFDEVTNNNLFSTHSQCSPWKNSTSWWFSSSSTERSFCRANNTTEYYRLLIITDYCTLRQYHQFQSLLHSLKNFGWQHLHLSVIQLIVSSMALLQSTHYNYWSAITEPAITLTKPILDSTSSLPQTCANYYYNEFYNYFELHSVKIRVNYI